MAAQYVIRIDDICPTMDWNRWDELENHFLKHGVNPLLAVIPDNQDPELRRFPANDGFWDRVRSWQQWGWTIGLHGYQHLYATDCPGITGTGRAYSEFAGLPFEVQQSKLQAAVSIFEREGVTPQVWVAPGHAFDRNTVRGLEQVGIRTISDGLQLFPHRDSNGFLWIPQQIGKFRRFPTGIWTVCIHLDDPLYGGGTYLEKEVAKLKDRIVAIPEIQDAYSQRQLTTMDKCFAQSLNWMKRIADGWG